MIFNIKINFSVFSIWSPSLEVNYLRSFANPILSFRLIDNSIENRASELYSFDYDYDDNDIIESLTKSFECVKYIIFEHLDNINNLYNYIDFCKYMRITLLEKTYGGSYLLIKANNHELFLDVQEKRNNMILKSFDNNVNDANYLESKRKFQEQILNKVIKPRDEIYENPELYTQAINELKKIKANNIETLKKYGFKNL